LNLSVYGCCWVVLMWTAGATIQETFLTVWQV